MLLNHCICRLLAAKIIKKKDVANQKAERTALGKIKKKHRYERFLNCDGIDVNIFAQNQDANANLICSFAVILPLSIRR